MTGPAITLVIVLVLAGLAGCSPRRAPEKPQPPVTGRTEDKTSAQPTVPADKPAIPWSQTTFAGLSLEQKVGQLFSVPAYSRTNNPEDPDFRKLVDLVQNIQVGGVVFFQGTRENQVWMANALQERARVPLLVSQDMEWGPGMRLDRTTTFPRTMAVGATRDPRYAFALGYVTAREGRALGVQQVFAPVADVNNNPENPIINVRAFGERPELVSEMVEAEVDGIRAGGGLATLKHFPGHGDTATDSHADLPVLPYTQSRLDSLELVPFRSAIEAGARSVMIGHLALPLIERETNLPASLSATITSGILRTRLGFDGLIVTDALNMSGVTKHYSSGEIAVRAIEAGADMLLMSEDPYVARNAILEAVKSGRLSEARVDASVRRILAAKEDLGLPVETRVQPDRLPLDVDNARHRAVSDEVARRSLTLLRNSNNLLPLLDAQRRILNVTLSDGNDESTGQFFIEQLRRTGSFQSLSGRLLNTGSKTRDYREAVAEAAEADIILVSAFVYVRSGNRGLNEQQQEFVNRLVDTGKPVVLISFGNPYLVTGLKETSVYIAAYSQSEASQKAAAEALFGKGGFYGRLPITIPGYFAYGAGLTVEPIRPRAGAPEDTGMDSRVLIRVDSLIEQAIQDHAFPGAVVTIGRSGSIVFQKGFGRFTYESTHQMTPESAFDLASLTKVVATTSAVMKLFEQHRIELDAPVARYVPEFGQNGKDSVTVRQLLTHTGGLIPFRTFHLSGLKTRQQVIDAIMKEKLEYRPGTESRYSDFGPIVLALAIERITGQDFGRYVQDEIFHPLGMVHTGFRTVNAPDTTIVPTEIDHAFRKRLVQGEVHDETAWLLGGTSGNAGLFSTANDLARFAYMMTNDGRIDGILFLKPETIRLFTSAAEPGKHTRALGWDTRSPQGYSSAGRLFGPRSFGHTGYTGTSIWFDPDQDLFLILLTNRVYPTRENTKIMDVRAALADIVYSSIAGPPTPLAFIPLAPNLSTNVR